MQLLSPLFVFVAGVLSGEGREGRRESGKGNNIMRLWNKPLLLLAFFFCSKAFVRKWNGMLSCHILGHAATSNYILFMKDDLRRVQLELIASLWPFQFISSLKSESSINQVEARERNRAEPLIRPIMFSLSCCSFSLICHCNH